MIPLPWLLVGWGVSLAIVGATAYVKGDGHARADMLAAAGQAQIASVRLANRYTAEDIDAARAAAERAFASRARAQRIQHELEMETLHGRLLTLDPPPAAPGAAAASPPAAAAPAGPVRVSAAGMGLLNAGIAAYNAAAGAPGGSSDPLPPDPQPGPLRQPGRAGPAATAGGNLRISDYLRWHASRVGGVAAAAD